MKFADIMGTISPLFIEITAKNRVQELSVLSRGEPPYLSMIDIPVSTFKDLCITPTNS
jgi:hypothetical protein